MRLPPLTFQLNEKEPVKLEEVAGRRGWLFLRREQNEQRHGGGGAPGLLQELGLSQSEGSVEFGQECTVR